MGVFTDELILVIIFCRLGAAGKGQRVDHERKGVRESRAVPVPDANAELVLSMQVIWAISNLGSFMFFYKAQMHN